MELIVVLVILGVMAAVAIPAMTGWIDRARNRDAVLECRAVVIAAQGQVAELYGKSQVGQGQMNTLINSDDAREEILKMAGTFEKGGSIKASSVIIGDGMQVTGLTYTTGKSVTVVYDKDGSPQYQIKEKGKYTDNVPGYHEQASDIKSNPAAWDENVFLDSSGKVKEEYKKYFGQNWSDVKKYPTKRLQAAYLEENGQYPKVDWDQIHPPGGLNANAYDAVWKPILTLEGELIMIADSKSASDTGNAVGNGMAAVIYYNGTYYCHKNGANLTRAFIDNDKFSIAADLTEGNNWVSYVN